MTLPARFWVFMAVRIEIVVFSLMTHFIKFPCCCCCCCCYYYCCFCWKLRYQLWLQINYKLHTCNETSEQFHMCDQKVSGSWTRNPDAWTATSGKQQRFSSHPNVNREDGFSLSKSRKSLLQTLKEQKISPFSKSGSVSPSWLQAPSGTRDQIFISSKIIAFFLCHGASFLATRLVCLLVKSQP